MTKESFVENIRSYCLANANADNVKKYSRYFKEGYQGYGLTAQQIKEKTKELLKQKEIDLTLVIRAMPLLMESGYSEEISLGLLVINGMHKQYNKEMLRIIDGWFSMGIYNWAHADTLGMWILPQLMEKELASIDDFKDWLKSPYKFQRRCIPVTFIKLLKGRDHYIDLFSFLEPLMMDPEREVHQGMGWFLREAWKIRNQETEAFLLKWKDLAPRLIFQYACEKMTSEQKLRFKKRK